MKPDVYDVNTRPYHHGDLRRALLECATAIIEEEGLDRLSLRAVAGRAGVSPMAPYRHFADKAALLAAVGEHGFTLLRDRLTEVGARTEGRELMIGWGVAYVGFAREHPDLFRLMFRGPPTWRVDQSEDIAERPDTTLGMTTAAMRALFPPEEVNLAQLTAWSFLHGLATLIIDQRIYPFPPDVDALTREINVFFSRRFFPADGSEA